MQPGHPVSGDRNPLATDHLGEQARELRLSLVDADPLHGILPSDQILLGLEPLPAALIREEPVEAVAHVPRPERLVLSMS